MTMRRLCARACLAWVLACVLAGGCTGAPDGGSVGRAGPAALGSPRSAPPPGETATAVGTADPSADVAPIADRPVDPAPAAAGVTSLADLLARADAGHPALAAAGARVEQASGRAEQAGLFPNPEAVGRIESAPFRGRTEEEADVVAGFSQRLPVGGRLGAARAVEERDRERLARASEAERLAVRTRIRRAYVEAAHHRATAEAFEQAATIAEKGVAIARARQAAGDVTADEVARAEMDLARARLDRDAATARYAQGLQSLATAVGDPGLRVVDVDAEDPDLEPMTSVEPLPDRKGPPELPSSSSIADPFAVSSDRHPAVAAADAQIEVERARAELARAERIPDVSLDLFYRRLGEEGDGFDVGAAISLPLFDRNQGKLREARAGVVAAQEEARATRLQADGRQRELRIQLDRALAAARAGREEVLPRAESVLQTAERRYAAGDVGLAEVLLARRDWIAARLQVLEAVQELRDAWAELQQYVGPGR